MGPNLETLRQQCPLPVLMHKTGLQQFVKSSCRSPFRNDNNASWGIYQRNGRWMYKDFATDECGDEIALLSHIYQLDQRRDFLTLLERYAELAERETAEPIAIPGCIDDRPDQLPDTGFLRPGTDDQIRRLSELRKISPAGLMYAQERGVLKFGDWYGYEVFAVVDSSGKLAELRRLDGLQFGGNDSINTHKSHTVKHSRKNWPLGILEATESEAVALVEGLPDFLAMHQFLVSEGLIGRVAPVAMLSSGCEIAADALHHFLGKHVRVFPHLDLPGVDAAERWQTQLMSASAANVDFFNFGSFEIAGQGKINDLCDFNQQRGAAGFQRKILNNLI